MNLVLTPHGDWARLVGVAICECGLVVTLWARRTLSDNWSFNVVLKQGHELVKSGPYRFVRHPIYAGILLICLGTAVEAARVRGWLGLPFLWLGFWIKLRQEERLMRRHFPDQYPAYEKQVKALVPFVI